MDDQRVEIVLRKLNNGWYAGSNKTDFPGGNKLEAAGWDSPESALLMLLESLDLK